MREELVVSKVPKTAGIVGHGIGWAGDVMVAGYIAFGPLVQGTQAEEISPRRSCRGGAFGSPGDGRAIVAIEP